jgi:hypothetical protein
MNSEKTIEDRLKTVIKEKFGLVEMRPALVWLKIYILIVKTP